MICVLIARYTAWGRQFWRITGDYFTGPESVKVWLWLGGAVAVGDRRAFALDVLLSFQGNDMMTSFQVVAAGLGNGDDAVKNSGKDGFWFSMRRFRHLGHPSRRPDHAGPVPDAAVHAARGAPGSPIGSPATGSTARPTTGPGSSTTRSTTPISASSSDIDIFTAGVGPLPNTPNNTSTATLLFGAVDAVASMISFTAILWNLSGTLTLPIVGVELPRAMFWILLVYVLFASVIAFWIGRPIIWLSFNNEKFNAAFRYALVRLARCVGGGRLLPRASWPSARGCGELFAPVVSNYKRYVNRMMGFYGWNLSMSQIIVPPPYLLAVPAIFSRRDHARRHDPVRVGVRQHPGRPVVLP